MTAAPDTVSYPRTRDDLRRELCRASAQLEAEAANLIAAGDTGNPRRVPLLLAANYAYTLAGSVEWVRREYGAGAAHGLAQWMLDVLVNGDDGERPMNADVLPAQVREATRGV